VYTAEIKKVLAKIHVGDMVHYITDPMETVIFVPLKDFDEDECVSGKWATILSLVKKAWETGETDIYAVVQTTCGVEPNVEFVLTTLAVPHQQLCPYVQLPPLDKKTGRPMVCVNGGNAQQCPMALFRPVGVKELSGLLNG
jgi:uncharacterized protein YqgV (UPF0045/DUF77 family)